MSALVKFCLYLYSCDEHLELGQNSSRAFISEVIKAADVGKTIVGLGACWHVKRSTQMFMPETCWCSEMGVLDSLTLVSISIPRL